MGHRDLISITIQIESTDGWDYEEIVLTRKEAKRLRRALKKALKK